MTKQYGGDIQQDVDLNTQQIQELQQELRDLRKRVQELVPQEIRQKSKTNFQGIVENQIAQNKEKQARVEKFQGVVHEQVGVTKGLDALEQQQKDWDAAKTSSSPASCVFSKGAWCNDEDLVDKGYQLKGHKDGSAWCCPPGINQPMPEGSEGDLLGFGDDYRPSQPSQSVTSTSQSAPTVDLLDAEPQFTGKSVDVPSEEQEEQQTLSESPVIETNCRKISVADGSCKATPGCHPATPEEFKAYKKQQPTGTNMSKVKKPCLQGEAPILGGKKKNNKITKGGNTSMAVDYSDGIDYENNILNNTNLNPELKVAALFMLTGGCQDNTCSNVDPHSPLANALTQYASVHGQDSAVNLVNQFRQVTIQLLSAVCNAQASNNLSALGSIESAFNEKFPLTSIGGGFQRGACSFLLSRFGIVDQQTGQFTSNWFDNCQAASDGVSRNQGAGRFTKKTIKREKKRNKKYNSKKKGGSSKKIKNFKVGMVGRGKKCLGVLGDCKVKTRKRRGKTTFTQSNCCKGMICSWTGPRLQDGICF